MPQLNQKLYLKNKSPIVLENKSQGFFWPFFEDMVPRLTEKLTRIAKISCFFLKSFPAKKRVKHSSSCDQTKTVTYD